jgi:hypothetical protein
MFVPDCLSRLKGKSAQTDDNSDILDDLEYMHYGTVISDLTTKPAWELDPVYAFNFDMLRWTKDPRTLLEEALTALIIVDHYNSLTP